MPNFKQTPIKKVKTNRRASSTLDSKHREFVNEFHKDLADKIPKLKQEQQMLKEVLKEKGANMQVEEILDIKDAIREISQKIKEIKQKKKDYFLDNSKYIFEYFENKKDISNNAPSTSAPPVINTKTKMVNNFFKIKQPEQEEMNNLSKNIVLKYLCNVDESFLDVNHYMN